MRIKRFWSWLTPGFWAATLRTTIETDLQVAGSSTVTNVSVTEQESVQMAPDSAWISIVDKGLAAYRAQAAGKFQGPPF